MNKTTQRYFINLFKRKKRILALYTFVVFMAYPFLLLTDLITNGGNRFVNLTEVMFALCLVVLGALAFILPLFTFKFVFSKKNVDTYYAIPINRNHLFKAHFIAPILGTIIPILASYLVGGLFIIPSSGLSGYFELLVVLLMSFLMFITIYSMNTFIIMKCNNILDASIISGAIGIVPFMLYGAMYTFLRSQIVRSGMIDSFVDAIPQMIIDLFSPYRGLALMGEIVRTRSIYQIFVSFKDLDYVLFFYYIVIGILFMIYAKKSFKFKKGEDAEQLTTHYLTYPLLTNLALITLILNFNITEYDITTAVIIMIVLFVLYVIINAIANRSFKIKTSMILKFLILFIGVNAFNIISKETEFFGINRKVIDYTNYEEIEINYSFYDYGNETSEVIVVDVDPENISEDEIKLFDYFKEIQKEKSLAFKEDDQDRLYPNNGKGDYNLNITYNYYKDATKSDRKNQYVHYQLSDEQARCIQKIMKEIKGK